jgi:glyoxylase-like metal-dependent hydrolase (beta-lactamase superfamily II)
MLLKWAPNHLLRIMLLLCSMRTSPRLEPQRPAKTANGRRTAVKPIRLLLALAAAGLAISPPAGEVLVPQAWAQGAKSGVERLYILNCGEGVVGDISRWSPGVNVGKSMDFVDNCYLIKHSQGWLLWDTGLADAIAAMPEGQRPADPRMTHWRRPKTLAAQLDQLGMKPSDVKYVAISHTHPDHIGNVTMFPQSMLLVQKAEYEWPSPVGPRFKPEQPVTKLEGDHDVFGDGSVMIISTPGHTPGHQGLLVKLPKTGAVLLSGDAVHFKDNWENRRVPQNNDNKETASPRCSAWRTSWRKKRRSSGSTTTRRSATAKKCRPNTTSEQSHVAARWPDDSVRRAGGRDVGRHVAGAG